MDLTVAAVPFYFASMGAEAWWLRRDRDARPPTGGDYERRDTITSLSMGVGSLLVPLVTRPLFRDFDAEEGRWGRALLGVAGGAALVAGAADAVARANGLRAGRLPARDRASQEREAAEADLVDDGEVIDLAAPQGAPSARWLQRLRRRRTAQRVAGSAALTAIAAGGAVVCGTWANRTMASRLFGRRVLPDWGSGPVAAAAAVLGWDFIYYWNHRIMHEARYLWAIHVVHHSSEHYNLSTALRQPVADVLGTFVPYGLLAWLGIRPELIEQARGINLIYQFWIHTEVIRSVGPLEQVLNTPSHHRVHHGANRQYLDRNHGSILIVWDKLFGTFEAEDEPVRYGLTRNIHTSNPLRVATHEYVDIAEDVAGATTWADRLGFVLRGPGWAYARRAGSGAAPTEDRVPVAAG
jgi:sterol desaturase/sphingolipid hydroxylase (fatty acid hydroxylase superfamily)